MKKEKALRRCFYIYPAQLQTLREISYKRKKSLRWIFFEAIQTYIGLYREGKV